MPALRRSKGGRPPKYVPDADGKPIVGLSYNKHLDKFYATHSSPRVYFGSNPLEAISRFRRWEARQKGRSLDQIESSLRIPLDNVYQIISLLENQPEELRRSPEAIILGIDELDYETGWTTYDRRDDTLSTESVSLPVLRERIRKALLTNLHGFGEWVGLRLDIVDKPSPSLTLEQLGKLYLEGKSVTPDWRRKAKLFWTEFCDAVAPATTVAGVTVEAIRSYRDKIRNKHKAEEVSAVYVKHRFRSIVTILRFAEKEGHSSPELTQFLHNCRMLTLGTSGNGKGKAPHPISPEDFHKLLKAARNNTAMTSALHLGLNCGMYPSELLALDKADLNLAKGTLVTARPKTGMVRVGVLWPATRKAVQAHLKATAQNQTDALFVTDWGKGKGRRTHIKTICRWFRELRNKAGVDVSVKFEDLRDGAQTAAIEHGADPMHVKILLGHSVGIDDAYLKRNPRMVEDACQAIERTYFSSAKKQARSAGRKTS